MDKGKAASREVSWESAAKMVMAEIRKGAVRKEGRREGGEKKGREEEGGREAGREDEGGREGGW